MTAAPPVMGLVRGRARFEPDARAVVERAASWLARASEEARGRHGFFAVALSGAEPWRAVYARLTEDPYRDAVVWTSWYAFVTDDDAAEARTGDLLRRELLARVPIPDEHFFPIRRPGETPQTSADRYHELLAELLLRGEDHVPRLDCVTLALGADGGVAGLSRGGRAGRVRHRWAAVQPSGGGNRLTVTMPVLNAAATAAVLVTGAAGGRALWGLTVSGAPVSELNPAHGELLWFVDAAAAAAFTDSSAPAGPPR